MIKAYTSVEQSRKLMEFLPIESADMCYMEYATSDDPTRRYEGQSPMVLGDIPITEIDVVCIPCWSLAALLEIIPIIIRRVNNICRLRMDKSEEDFDIWYEEVDSGLAQLDLDIITPSMVDACVEMIEKLHNEKLL